MANKRARRGAGRNKRGLNVEFDGVLIDEGSGEGTEKLGDPESVPHADGAEQAAERRDQSSAGSCKRTWWQWRSCT